MDTLFISDLHLSPERPEKLHDFKRLLHGPARDAKAVYILGDLFEEFWVGNDDITPPNDEIITELLELTSHGTPLYIIKGNRELLLDEKFTLLTGANILPDEAVIDLDGTRVLLMHGDLLCVRDIKYQRFRRIMVNRFIQKCINLLPYKIRIFLSHSLRPTMNRSVMKKSKAILDVEQSMVKALLKEHEATELIHGHTHHPAIHDFQINGQNFKRIVLGDWYENAEILVSSNGTRRLIPVSTYLENFSTTDLRSN